MFYFYFTYLLVFVDGNINIRNMIKPACKFKTIIAIKCKQQQK